MIPTIFKFYNENEKSHLESVGSTGKTPVEDIRQRRLMGTGRRNEKGAPSRLKSTRTENSYFSRFKSNKLINTSKTTKQTKGPHRLMSKITEDILT